MMITQTSRRTASRAWVAAAGVLAALALAGCENPEPTAAPEQPTAAPPAPDAPLMGAPEGVPTTRTPQYVGPNGPPPSYPPPPPPAYGPHPYGPPPYAAGAPSANSYPPGYGHVTGPGAPAQIVAMAPIANPPERGEYYGHWYGARLYPHRRHRHHLWVYGGEAWRPAHAHPHHAAAMASTAPRPPVAPSGARPAPQPGAPHAVAPAPAPSGQLRPPHTPSHHRHAAGMAGATAATAAAASGGPTNGVGETPAASASEADRYKALEQSLHDAFESVAVLNVPANMPAGQASTVTLTLPAEFAAAVQRDTAQQGLPLAAASLNLLATLSGDGYTITPTEPQSVALASNQPTTFQWQVTPGSGARAPLKASVRAQAVSAGQYMNLGDKTSGDSMLAGKIVGIGLLVLIAALILGWAMRRGAKPRQTIVRRPAYDQYTPPPPSGRL